jgi:molybdate transport system ATP-binding protein
MDEPLGTAPTLFHATLQQSAPIPLAAEITCRQGELLALVGPSGSGKSTLLRSIAGLHTPQHGRIVCNGETWLDTAAGIRLATAHRRIGMVFQNYALFPHLSALENILEGMDDPAAPDARQRAQALLRKVHLDGLAARYPAQLSGGQQQRVAVARALARDPHVLLLDEPFSAVDRATREKLYVELADLRRDLKMPVILVTHDLDEASMLADRMTILSRGRTIQNGTPLDIRQRPASVEAARLVGMKNLFDGEIIAHEPSSTHTLIDWHGQRLKVRLQPDFPPGTRISWALPAADVLLMPLDHDSRDDLDNPVFGRIVKIVALGETLHLQVQADIPAGARLSLTVSHHIAHRYALAEGQQIMVRLRGDHIHLMPADDNPRQPRRTTSE